MRRDRGIRPVVLLLTVAVAGGPATADPRRGTPKQPRPERSTAAEIDLGAGTLDRFELLAGPFELAVGLHDRLFIGTYVVPWTLAAIVPGSFSANAFAKAAPLRIDHDARRYALSAEGGAMFARLDDLDNDGLDARAWIFPFRFAADARWNARWSTTLELAGARVVATAEKASETDTEIEALALANSLHLGAVLRYRPYRRLTLWARARVLLDHDPVIAEGTARLSPEARIIVKAQANAAELSSAGSFTAGLAWTRWRTNLRLGLGYGHWMLPWVNLPYGKRTVTADLDLYWRF